MFERAGGRGADRAGPAVGAAFERGDFTAHDGLGPGGMVAAYALGVWADCALTVLVRGFSALANRDAGSGGRRWVALNLALNLVLIWLLGEAGLGV